MLFRSGYGSLSTSQIVSRLIQFYESTHKITDEEILASQKKKAASKKKKGNGLGVIVQGADNLKARMAKCCNPVPGDSIIGFVTRGRGVTVHRADCLNISNIEDDDRLMQAQWDLEEEAHYNAEVCIRAIAKTGLLAAITNRIADSNISINAIDAKTNKDKISTINIILEIHDIDELNRLMDRFKNIENVLEVYRVTG